jgi:hypothetical protein
MIRNDSDAFRKAIDEVAKQLVTAEHRNGMSFVRVPLVYPSGAGVVVRVSDSYPDFFVSDYGSGYEEAEMMGASAIYARHAPNIAKSAGVGFDQHSFFVMKANKDQLPGVIVTVANCALETVITSALKLAEKKHSDDIEFLYQRLVRLYTTSAVSKDAEVVGQSTTKWHVATIVNARRSSAIFEPVSKHHTSVFAVTAKFQDISRLENPPSRVSVVKRKAEMDSYLALLSQTGSVIEMDQPDETYLRLIAA